MTQTTNCIQGAQREGRAYPKTCPDCGLGPCKKYPKPDYLTKENIIAWVTVKADDPDVSESDRRYFNVIRFVLKNRTEQNWGPKELTMNEAMSGRMP